MTTELLGEMMSTFDMSRATAYRLRGRLIRSGYIRTEHQGRSISNHPTEEGRKRVESKGRAFVSLLK